jgi:hypothetical protein
MQCPICGENTFPDPLTETLHAEPAYLYRHLLREHNYDPWPHLGFGDSMIEIRHLKTFEKEGWQDEIREQHALKLLRE